MTPVRVGLLERDGQHHAAVERERPLRVELPVKYVAVMARCCYECLLDIRLDWRGMLRLFAAENQGCQLVVDRAITDEDVLAGGYGAVGRVRRSRRGWRDRR